jgi:hypothetical protein
MVLLLVLVWNIHAPEIKNPKPDPGLILRNPEIKSEIQNDPRNYFGRRNC